MPDEVLQIISSEILPENTDFMQLKDGTIVYYQKTAPERLRFYVKFDGKEIEAAMPDDNIITYVSHENAVYFQNSRSQIYKAVFSPPSEFTVSYLREQDKYEKNLSWGAICSNKRDGKEYVYRAYEKNEIDGILVDLSEKELERRYLLDAIGNKLVYISTSTGHDEKHRLRALSDNIILLELRPRVDVSGENAPAQDGSFFYVVHGVRLLVADFETMELLPALRFTGILPPIEVRCVRDGLVTVRAERGGRALMITAKLPKGYSEKTKKRSQQQSESDDDEEDEFISEFQSTFKPLKVLGQGGYGCVFAAENRMDKWKYAVKRIPLRGKEQEKNKALTEVWALASFDHPNIVRYNDAWKEEPPEGWQSWQDELLLEELESDEQFFYKDDCSFLYIQMELCQFTLVDWLSENEYRDQKRMKSWFRQIVSAVGYIHGHGKIHRDLKPSNILFADDNRLKICDLGIVADRAIRNGQEVAMTRTMGRGTSLYMAPEQSGWSGYSAKVDIFALGLILAQICVPISDDAAEEAFEKYRRGKPNTILSSLPDVEHFVTWLTNPKDTERPECAEILAHSFMS